MPIYNKLVRDRIPQIIEKAGMKFSMRVMEKEEYKIELQKKLTEELAEYMETKSNESAIEELADLLEIIYALAEAHGSSIEELEEVRLEKTERRGGFQERLFLIKVEDQ